MLLTMGYTKQSSRAKDRYHLRSGKHRCQKTIDRLTYLRQLHEELTSEELQNERIHKDWVPSLKAIEEMLKPGIQQADRVEMVFVDYKVWHGTNAPSLQEIATTLAISKYRVNEYVDMLVDQGRAVRIPGQFWIVGCGLNHPFVKRILDPERS